MKLAEALQPRKGDIVAFVGAGGKSSAMRRLAVELAADDWRVVATSTTRIRVSEADLYKSLIVEDDPQRLLKQTREALDSKSVPLIVASGRLEAEGKLVGVSYPTIRELGHLADAVLVEADGARGRSIKAPASHEPAIPPATSLVLPVVGLDALGQLVGSPAVHRPERLMALLGVDPSQTIAPEDVARLLTHAEGGFKQVPSNARFIPLLNKAEGPDRLSMGRRVAWLLKRRRHVDAVLIGAVQGEEPILERWERVGAVVLAAGQANRYGEVKQLLPLAGRPLLHHVLDAVLAAPVDQVSVVLGAHAQAIADSLEAYSRDARVAIVWNRRWQDGLSTSMQQGLRELGDGAGAALMVLGDQPGISGELVERLLIRRARTGAPLVAPAWRGRRGNPVLFGRSLFAELEAVTGDEGGRSVVREHRDQIELVDVPDEAALFDIDTPDDYVRALRAWHAGTEK